MRVEKDTTDESKVSSAWSRMVTLLSYSIYDQETARRQRQRQEILIWFRVNGCYVNLSSVKGYSAFKSSLHTFCIMR